ncbi:hypothetical protein DAI22_04g140650 [Oryza sativa Japonica Group]|nr:hypothetical protein DAI22_04g140650 [Oryza sativa Japonica Group]
MCCRPCFSSATPVALLSPPLSRHYGNADVPPYLYPRLRAIRPHQPSATVGASLPSRRHHVPQLKVRAPPPPSLPPFAPAMSDDDDAWKKPTPLEPVRRVAGSLRRLSTPPVRHLSDGSPPLLTASSRHRFAASPCRRFAASPRRRSPPAGSLPPRWVAASPRRWFAASPRRRFAARARQLGRRLSLPPLRRVTGSLRRLSTPPVRRLSAPPPTESPGILLPCETDILVPPLVWRV